MVMKLYEITFSPTGEQKKYQIFYPNRCLM